MADFVAVIRKAVVNLSDNTPENRERVYEKARSAIRRQLEAMNPPPAEEIVARQMMLFGLAVDHFIVDGLESLTAARELKQLIEDPSELLGPR